MIKNKNIDKVIEAVKNGNANQEKVNLVILKCIKELNSQINGCEYKNPAASDFSNTKSPNENNGIVDFFSDVFGVQK